MLILALLYTLFNSLRDSLLALAGIPFAIGGGIIALYVTGLAFSISSAIGFISLFGVSVMNGILIITYYNQLTDGRAMDASEALFHAAEQRMRPMLMTSLAACIGLLPAAMSNGIGSQVQKPLATVVVGGHADRTHLAAAGRAGAAADVPGQGRRRADRCNASRSSRTSPARRPVSRTLRRSARGIVGVRTSSLEA